MKKESDKMQFIIREAIIDDYENIYELNKHEMGYEYPKEDTKLKLHKLLKSNHDKIYVAVIDENVIGYIHINDYDVIYAPHMKNIMGIAVSKNYQRNGIGRALLEKAEMWALETGAVGIRLVSGSQRTDAHKFYRGCGFIGDKMQLNLKKVF